MNAAQTRGPSSTVLSAQSLGHLLRRQAQEIGSRTFLRFEGVSATFAEVERRTNQLANLLSDHLVRKGDRVAVVMQNGLAFPTVWLSLAKIGAVIVPVNVQYRERDLQYSFAHSGATVAIAGAEQEGNIFSVKERCPDLREILTLNDSTGLPLDTSRLADELRRASEDFALPDHEPGDVLNLQYTSGTTGLPKACMLTHEYWLRCAQAVRECSHVSEDDVMMTAQPFYYMDPQWQTVLCLTAGIPLLILPRFSASSFWQSARDNGVTLFYVLGSMPLYLLKQSENPEFERKHKVRLVLCSGIPVNLHAALESRWNVPWREMYGTTESGADIAVPIEDNSSVGSGAIGKAVPGKEARVVDCDGRDLREGEVGELIIRGKTIMLGYYKNPEATAEKIRDGWLYTGDLVFRDEKGYFHIVGRIKEMIRRSGENISAAEVESVICEHPAVWAAAVVPVADDVRGEEIKAFIQLRPGQTVDTAPPGQLVDFVKSRLAPFKAPRYLEYVDDFPRTPSERIAKHKLLASNRDQRSGSWDAVESRWIV